MEKWYVSLSHWGWVEITDFRHVMLLRSNGHKVWRDGE